MSYTKDGLDYFSFDVDFFEDPKVEFITARFGIKGKIILVELLCRIYRNGYYLDWDEDQAIIFAKRVGDGITYALVNDVVNESAKRGFFEKSILTQFNVLTSKGIQKRFFEAAKRRKTIFVKEELLLISDNLPQNVNILRQNVNILKKYEFEKDKNFQNDDILSQNANISNQNANILLQSKVKESINKEREGEPQNFEVPNKHEDLIFKVWILTYKRNPVNTPEIEFVSYMLNRYGFDETKRIMYEYCEKGFKLISTMKNELIEVEGKPQIRPREKYATSKQNIKQYEYNPEQTKSDYEFLRKFERS